MSDPNPEKSFDSLFNELADRIALGGDDSRTVELIQLGTHAIGKKIVEEAAEVWMAAEHEGPEALSEEISQLIYHLQVLMHAHNLSLHDVYKYL